MALLLQLVLLIAFPPLLPGIIGRTKAFFAGRKGPPFFQAYYDVLRLLRKGAVFSATTTWVFRAGPMIALGSVLTAGLLVPMGGAAAPLAFEGDLVLFAALLALGRLATILAALDVGSSFEGMGASREAAYSALVEPALFLSLAILAVHGRTVSLTGALGAGIATGSATAAPVLAIAVIALFVVYVTENARMPVDDPATHLELTMIHEVMVLDHGGPDYAFIVYASSVKLAVVGALVVGVLVPGVASGGAPAGLALAGLEILLAVAVGVVESVRARLRLPKVPQFLISAAALALVGIVILLWKGRP